MPHDSTVLTYNDLLDIGLAPDVTTFERLLVRAAAELGYGLAAGVMVRGRFSSGRAAVRPFGNTPAAFVEASRTLDLAVRDPLLTALLARPGVVTYNQRFYVDGSAAELWDVQSPFGYREGMAVSMHTHSHAEVFTFGVDGHAVPATGEGRLRLEGELRLLCAHAQQAAKRLYFPEPAPAASRLGAQETEALKWAADGVSVWVTGDKMSISNMGVEQLLEQAQRKLGAASRQGAVLRAIDGGLINR